MSNHPTPTGPQNQSLKKFHEIYEKILRDSRSFVSRVCMQTMNKGFDLLI